VNHVERSTCLPLFFIFFLKFEVVVDLISAAASYICPGDLIMNFISKERKKSGPLCGFLSDSMIVSSS
jgi:hypothetical protein